MLIPCTRGFSSPLSLVSERPQHNPFPIRPSNSCLVVLGVLAVGSVLVVGRAILSLETDSLVDDKVARARVDGGADGKADDDTWARSLEGGEGWRDRAAHQEGSAQGGSF